jgi:hypothetical protein
MAERSRFVDVIQIAAGAIASVGVIAIVVFLASRFLLE